MAGTEAFWKGKAFSFFTHYDCEFYPCHPIAEGETLNCLFCYCPLYMLGKECGGEFRYLENGVKDCSQCLLPHRPENFGLVTERFQDIAKRMAKEEAERERGCKAGADGGHSSVN